MSAAPSLPVRQAALAGPQWVSAAGSTVTYSTLDNNKSPTSGFNSQLKQDLAGLGGDARFLRTTEDLRYYHPINDDVVNLARAQGGYVTGWGGHKVPQLNSFFGGPTMVRGFAPNGFGPRDLTAGTTMDNVGGSMYWATTGTAEQHPRRAPGVWSQGDGLCRRGQRVSLHRADRVSGLGTIDASRQLQHRALLGRCRPDLGLTVRKPAVDYAVPLTEAAFDVAQPLRFSAGGF